MMDLLTCFKARLLDASRSCVSRTACLDTHGTVSCDVVQRNSYEDTRCAGEIKALTQCMAAQSTKPKEVNTITYHLQRLSRGG